MKPETKEKCKERLKKIIGTKIQTTMVFPISQFEMAFGELWGHGKDAAVLNEQEKVYRKKWEQCRENIFNNGNQQKRNAHAEIDMYDVEWLRYRTVLYPVQGNQND